MTTRRTAQRPPRENRALAVESWRVECAAYTFESERWAYIESRIAKIEQEAQQTLREAGWDDDQAVLAQGGRSVPPQPPCALCGALGDSHSMLCAAYGTRPPARTDQNWAELKAGIKAAGRPLDAAMKRKRAILALRNAAALRDAVARADVAEAVHKAMDLALDQGDVLAHVEHAEIYMPRRRAAGVTTSAENRRAGSTADRRTLQQAARAVRERGMKQRAAAKHFAPLAGVNEHTFRSQLRKHLNSK